MKAQFILFFFALSSHLTALSQNTTELGEGEYLKEINSPDSPPIGVTLIQNVRIIDGYGGDPIEKGFVLIKDGIIDRVGKGEATIADRKGTTVIDGAGKTLLPGLIDAHFHSVNNNEFLHLCLKNGVTSLRDPGHPFTFYQSIAFTKKLLPRIFLTGPHLDYPPVAYGQQATLVRSSEHARQIVQDYVKQGSSGIKIYFRLPLQYYPDVVKTAKVHKIPVFAHLELVTATDAILAGVNGIEHVTSFGTSIASKEVKEEFERKVDQNNNARQEERYRLWASLDMNSPKIREVIKLVIDKGIVVCSTLATFERQADSSGVEDFRVKGFKNMLKFVELLHKAGAKIVIGSHSSSLYSKHGWTYQREMELLQMIGMTPLEIIKSGTVNNAIYFGNSSRLGSIEEGKQADLVLVDGDPSSDITAMYKIDRVMINGNWVIE